jgi:hypothetical protein
MPIISPAMLIMMALQAVAAAMIDDIPYSLHYIGRYDKLLLMT